MSHQWSDPATVRAAIRPVTSPSGRAGLIQACVQRFERPASKDELRAMVGAVRALTLELLGEWLEHDYNFTFSIDDDRAPHGYPTVELDAYCRVIRFAVPESWAF